jgi:uncharacterized ferritin-like protein (DUF455 family)
MNFYKTLELILQTKEPKKKFQLFEKFYNAFNKDAVSFEERFETKFFSEPSYSAICEIVAPQDVPKRSNLTRKEGQINLLHAVAHIEYSAIDLALDAAYRFAGLPMDYYRDWLEVAADEIRHFQMLQQLLKELGSSYGLLSVHNALFEASQKTQTLLERMAVVPRYLEANGLDATPMILRKLKKLPQSVMIHKIIQNLEVILEEEIEHVHKGDRWFKYACEQKGVSTDIYFSIIKKYYPRGFLRPNDLNIEARREAGFSCAELQLMANKEVCF